MTFYSFRENLQWISKATNWDKFNAVASLGLIHKVNFSKMKINKGNIFKGHEKEAKKILDPYLPKGDQDQYGFKEGGALYAYGLKCPLSSIKILNKLFRIDSREPWESSGFQLFKQTIDHGHNKCRSTWCMPGSWFGRAWDPQSGHIRAAQGCTLSE